MTDTTKEILKLQQAGFTDQEIGEWAAQRRGELSAAGFSDEEIDTEFGRPPINQKAVANALNMAKAEFTAPASADGTPKQVTSFMEALEAGFQGSVTGLLARGKKPDMALPENPDMAQRIAASLGTVAGDMPAMVAGAIVGGGNPITGTAGAFALPAGLRQVIMDAYEKGAATDWNDFLERAGGTMVETMKGWVTGAATGGAGKLAGALPIASPTAKAAAVMGSEVATMTTVGKAMEGEIPKAMDFVDAAVVVGGLKAAQKVGKKLRNTFADKNVRPENVVEDSQLHPTVKADLVADNVDVPQLYGGNAYPLRFGKTTALPPPDKPSDAKVHAAREKILSHISIGKAKEEDPITFEDLYTQTIDNLNPIKVAEKSLGLDESKLNDEGVATGYQLMRLLRGSTGRAAQMLDHATYDFNTLRNNGLSLKAILSEKVNGKAPSLNDVRAYISARQALEADSQGVKTGFDIEAARTLVDGSPHLDRMMTRLVDFQNRAAAHLRDSEIISEKTYNDMVEKHKNFVPLFRMFEDAPEVKPLQEGAGVRNPIKHRFGSEREVIDPLESIIKNTYVYVTLAERNKAARTVVQNIDAERVPTEIRKVATLKEEEIEKLFNEFVTVRQQRMTIKSGSGGPQVEEKTDTQTTKSEDGKPASRGEQLVREKVLEALTARGFSIGEATQMLSRVAKSSSETTTTTTRTIKDVVKEIEQTEYIQELNIRLPSDAANIFRAVKTPLKNDEVIVFEQGKAQKYKVGKDVAEAMNAMDEDVAAIFSKILAVPARMLRAGSVLSPDFMLRNLIRDQVSAFALSKNGYVPVVDFMRGVMSLIKKDEHFQNWLKGGGANSAFISMDRQYFNQRIETLRELEGVKARAWNVAKTSVELLRITSELIENATRLGEFRKAEKTGLGLREEIQLAAFDSREVITDFARHGARMKALSMITAFLNARIQGEDRLVRAMHDNPLGVSAKLLASVTLPSVLLWLANKDDERYKELHQWEKDNFWIILTDDHIYRVPKPHTEGLVFGSLIERVLEAYEKQDPDSVKQLGQTIFSSVVPIEPPTVLAPMIDQFANRSTFTGGPIIPAALEKQLPEYQFTEYTTETAKKVGQLLNALPGMQALAEQPDSTFFHGVTRALTSPILLENYLRAWTGGLGMYLLKTADAGLRAAKVLPDPVKPADTLADMPVVKAFVVRYPQASSASIEEFYNKFAVADKHYQTFKAQTYGGEPTELDYAFQRGAGIRNVLGEQSKLARLIVKDPGISAEEKRQMIDQIYLSMIQMAKGGLEELNTINQAMEAPFQ